MLFSADFPVALLPLFVLVGATGTLAVRELWRSRSGVDAANHAWAATVATAATMTSAARIIQRSQVDVGRAALGVSLQYTLGALVILTFMLFAPRTRPRNGPAMALVVALLVLHLATPAFVGAPFLRTDMFGNAYYAFKIGPLVLVLLPLAIWAAVHWIRVIKALKGRAPWSMAIVGGIVIAALGSFANDALLNLGVIRSVHLLEYAFSAIAFLTSAQISQHVLTRYAGLASNVQQSKDELAESRLLLDRTRAELASSKKEVPRLAESALEGMIVHQRGRIVDANDAFSALFDMTIDELRGMPIAELFTDGNDAEGGPAALANTDAARELVATSKNGARFPVEIIGRAVAHEDTTLYVVSVRDITQRKQAAAHQLLTDRMVSLATLAAGAAHEINNPLAYVATNISLALDAKEDIPEEIIEGLRDAEEGCERIRRIVQDLGSLSRDEGDELGPVDVSTVIERAVRITQHQLRHRATVVRDFEATAFALANEVRLGQVLLNLIVNAAQAIPEGHAAEHQIRIATHSEDDHVVIKVTDTGTGITPEALPHIFDPFFTTKAHSGTGLGLSVCHSIVSQLGGEIAVASQLGVGTTFRVTLPAAPAARVPTPESVREVPHAPAKRGRILVVDDEPGVVRAIGRELRGHEITTAHSGSEALTLLAQQSFDLVLCDLMMPSITGMDVYEQLASRDPQLASRIVFMTGGAFTPRAVAFVADPARRCILKPIDFAKLRALVDAAVVAAALGDAAVGDAAVGDAAVAGASATRKPAGECAP